MTDLDAEEIDELEHLPAGVYVTDGQGGFTLVHACLGGDYEMQDILEYFELGELVEAGEGCGLELDRKELKQLKEMAAEYEDDHPEEFITMCRDMLRAAVDLGGSPVRFYSNF